MEPGTTLNYDGLRDATKDVLRDTGRTLQQAANDLGVSFGAVGRAARESGPKFSALQKQIVERYAGVVIRESTTFLVAERGA